MIDIHTHILPEADDGAIDIEMALEMAAMAADSGVSHLVATPHCNIPGFVDNYLTEELIHQMKSFQKMVKEERIPLQVLSGMEIFATENLPELLQKKKVLTLNGTRYFLVEFVFDEDPVFCDLILDKCARLGYIPVIAHPERYYFIHRRPQIALDWYCKGYCLQVNKGSVLGRFGRMPEKIAKKLLDAGCVTCIASDAHSSFRRTPHMSQVRDFLDENYGQSYRKLLMEDNPRKILTGELIFK